MSPILYLCLIIIIGACWGIVHLFGIGWLLLGIACWIGLLVWLNDKKNKADEP